MLMRRYIRPLFSLVVIANAASNAAAQSGVLIGVATPDDYETLWIVRDVSRPVHATLHDLLVPRPDGWWRVGTLPICPTEGPEGQAMEVLWRVRADSAPLIAEICHEVPASELPHAASVESEAAADSLEKEMVRCSWSRTEIKFVSPEYVAVGDRSGQTEECEPRGGRWYQTYYVSRFNGDSSLALTEAAGPRVDSAGRVAHLRALAERRRGEGCTHAVASFDSTRVREVGGEWYPARASGRWVPVLFTQIGTSDCRLDTVVDMSLASSLTGVDSLRPRWSVLARQVDGLRDALSSPSGDLVVARVSDSLVVYLSDGNRLGRRIGALPFPNREIVMIQWATGRSVARWDAEIAAMMRRGLPAPQIVPPPAAP